MLLLPQDGAAAAASAVAAYHCIRQPAEQLGLVYCGYSNLVKRAVQAVAVVCQAAIVGGIRPLPKLQCKRLCDDRVCKTDGE